MNRILLIDNPLDPSTWEKYTDIGDLGSFLRHRYPTWPATARIYHSQVSHTNDITPTNDAEVNRLTRLKGDFIVVVYPQDPATVAIVVAVAALVISIAVAYFFRPETPDPAKSPSAERSANNQLSGRKNTPRLNGRIPDIFGTVRSYPDLLTVPLRYFVDDNEYEQSYMCIGRGEYDISSSSIKEDETQIASIPGSGVHVYGPNTSPNSGSPQLSIGSTTATLRLVKQSSAVTGQVLKPPNLSILITDLCYAIAYSWGQITLRSDSDFNFKDYFEAGETVTFSGYAYNDGEPGGENWNLNGTYTIAGVSSRSIWFNNPTSVNPNWVYAPAGNPAIEYQTIGLASSGTKYVGPIRIDRPPGGDNLDQLLLNFVAAQGLYVKDSSNVQSPYPITISIGVTPLDANGTPIGSEVFSTVTVTGNKKGGALRGYSAFVDLGTPAVAYNVRAGRTTNTPSVVTYPVIADQIVWRDLYALKTLAAGSYPHFGNVTTVFTWTAVNEESAAIKDRKLNLVATRKIKTIENNAGVYSLSAGTSATNKASDIFAAVALDPYIGRRAEAELDLANLYTTQAAVEAYFGHALAAEFCCTFDSYKLSYEETAALIAQTIFCVAYRRGSVIRLSFEKVTPDSVLLFNHRNKLPGSEKRTVKFGNIDEVDGVQYEYTDPADGAKKVLYLPSQALLKPKKIEAAGVRNHLQAYFHSWRQWNKIQYQNTITEFEAMQEASLLLMSDRILVSDGTRADVQEGEVVAQVGLELTLSQEVTFVGGRTYSIFIQLPSGIVESRSITAGSGANKVVLGSATSETLPLDEGLYARPTYAIVANTDVRVQTFLVTEKDPVSTFTSKIQAVNYHDNYYQKDQDYVLNLIDINGNPI